MDNTSFPRRLAEERKARGYTQKQVADALGISDRTYSKWETGENEMDVSALCRLAEFYETSPAVFFPSEGLKPEGVREALAKEPVRRALKQLYADSAFFRFDLGWAKESCGWDEEIVDSLMILGAIGREPARINGQDSDLYYVRYGHLRLRLMTILLLASTRNEKQFGFDSYRRELPFLREKNTEAPAE